MIKRQLSSSLTPFLSHSFSAPHLELQSNSFGVSVKFIWTFSQTLLELQSNSFGVSVKLI